MNFTVRGLQAIPTPEKERIEYWDESTNGSFGIRVSTTGKRSWVVIYRHNGRPRRFTIGSYDRLSLAEAREKAKEVLKEAADGKDPAANKKISRKAETFGEISDEYIQNWAKPNKRSWEQDSKLLNWYVLDHWRSFKAREIKRDDVKALLRPIKKRAPIVSNRVLALIRKIFNYALEEDIGKLEYNPCHRIRPVSEKERAGQRKLTFEEIRQFWAALDSVTIKEAAAIMKLRLLSAQRGGEIRLMEWEELDLETGWWTIPGSKTKNKLAHRVPITDQIWDIIKSFEHNRPNSKFVFASPRLPGAAILNIHDSFDEARTKLSVPKFVLRDLRRTAASHMTGQLGIPRFDVKKILNHVEKGVTGVYDRHSYDPEKRRALTAWNNLLNRVLTDSAEDNVIMFEANKRFA